jgi:hypothetical protein
VGALRKAAKVLLLGFLLGLLDAWQSRYLHVGHFGKEAAIFYQVLLMVGAGVAALVSLYDSNWSPWRNALGLAMAIPIAAISDNVSLDLQTLKPYAVILPRTGYAWRQPVFHHTIFYPLASWVNAQTFAPGLIDGYAASIAIAVAYVAVQLLWMRFDLDSRFVW